MAGVHPLFGRDATPAPGPHGGRIWYYSPPPLPPGVGGYEEEGAQSMETSCPGNTIPPCIQFVVVCEYTVADCHSPRIDKMLI